MAMIKVWDMAYVRYTAPDLNIMRRFLFDFGMTEVSSTATRLWMRGSGSGAFIHETELGPPGVAAIGLQAGSIDDLQSLAANERVAVEALDCPGAGYVVRLRDPDGLAVEVVAGRTPLDVHPSGVRQEWNFVGERRRLRDAKRVAPGPATVNRLGHVAMLVTDLERSWRWYADRFGFIGSDMVKTPEGTLAAAFVRCDLGDRPADHHTLNLAAIPGKPAGLHHAGFEVGDLDDLVAGNEYLKTKDYQHTWGIGRHTLGSQVFDYWCDPWGNKVEHWTDGDLFVANDPTEVVDIPTMLSSQWGPPLPNSFI